MSEIELTYVSIETVQAFKTTGRPTFLFKGFGMLPRAVQSLKIMTDGQNAGSPQ